MSLRERGRQRHLFSLHTRLEAGYRDGPRAGQPSRLFLKLPLPELPTSRRMVADEARFYRAFGDDPALPLVRWLGADENADHPYLLLNDLSETHTTPAGPVPASRAQTEAMIDALARFHARW